VRNLLETHWKLSERPILLSESYWERSGYGRKLRAHLFSDSLFGVLWQELASVHNIRFSKRLVFLGLRHRGGCHRGRLLIRSMTQMFLQERISETEWSSISP
jgi:hypothetical protein